MKPKTESEKTNRLILKRLTSIEFRLGTLENTLRILESGIDKPKRYLLFGECVPPPSVCKDIYGTMIGNSSYEGFLGRLAEYYKCERMTLLVNPERNREDTIAIYYPYEKTAYSKDATVAQSTVLHEWFHHMVNLGVVFLSEKEKKEEEVYARKFAETFLRRIGTFG